MDGFAYEEMSGSKSLSTVSGFAFDNLAIYNGLSADDVDAVENEIKSMDKCLAHATGANAGYIHHYHSLGLCMKPSTWTSDTLVPTLCDSNASPDCVNKPFEWALASWTDKSNFGGEVGLARDGHVIVGPYNADGELWSCEDHDVCNGTFISDGSYVYVTTSTFPYVVGCWGPGATEYSSVAKSCSTNSCSYFKSATEAGGTEAGIIESIPILAGVLEGISLFAGVIAVAIASNLF